MSLWPCVLFVTSVRWTPTVIIRRRGRHPAVHYFRTWRPCLARLLWGVLTFNQCKTTELACSWVTPAATATWETIAVLNMISLWSHFFQIGSEGSKSMLCLSNTVLRGEQCWGNENETISSLCWMMLSLRWWFVRTISTTPQTCWDECRESSWESKRCKINVYCVRAKEVL